VRRVAVTGLGIVSPLGEDHAQFTRALRNGEVAVRPLGDGFHDLAQALGARAHAFEADAHFAPNAGRSLDRVSQFAVVASRQALASSGLRPGSAAAVGVILGSTTGGQTTVDESYARLYRDKARVPPLTIPKWMVNAPAAHITMEHGLTGPSFCIASACASSTHAIGIAYSMVASGALDAAVTGGADASITYGAVKCWDAMRIMAPDACRPFSLGRRGMVLGEGSAVFVLEPLEEAVDRGATIHAEILGFGSSSDAGDIAAPCADGAAAAMRACLSNAGLDPASVDYVNAHGTGTRFNDITETRAIRNVFGTHADKLAVSSTKSMHGHALGAAGAIELMAAIAAIRGGFVPPTASFGEPDPECDLDYVTDGARDRPVRVAISNSFAFGGHNAVIAVGAAERGAV
jgi:nodulation protein E